MSANSLYIAYEDYLIGRVPSLSTYYFYGSDPGGANEKVALQLIKYAIEKLLNWTVDTAVKRFDEYIIKQLKLERIILYIDYPTEVKKGDVEYILSLIYPAKMHLSPRVLSERIYRSVLEDKEQFPREYFSGVHGFQRFCYCLRYLIEHYKVFYNIQDVYKFFISSEGKHFLSLYRLKVPAEQLGINVLDALYEISKDNEHSQFYYCYYSFIEKEKQMSQKRIEFFFRQNRKIKRKQIISASFIFLFGRFFLYYIKSLFADMQIAHCWDLGYTAIFCCIIYDVQKMIFIASIIFIYFFYPIIIL